MAYSDVWTTANDATFQGRCWAALWDVAVQVLDGVDTYPNAPKDLRFARLILKQEIKLSGIQLANQVLRKNTIANDPVGSGDAAVRNQLLAVWDTLKGIG